METFDADARQDTFDQEDANRWSGSGATSRKSLKRQQSKTGNSSPDPGEVMY